MKLIDTNVIVYARGVMHPYRRSCRLLLERVAAGKADYCLSVEVLQEVLNIYHRRGRTSEAVRLGRELTMLFPTMLEVTIGTMKIALDMLSANRHLQSRDAVHVATVIQHDLEGIVSTDTGFDRISGITRFDPKVLGGEP